jgi:hypothetical protein
MITNHDPDDVVRRLIRWAERNDPVRAMLLTSTRARPGSPVDALLRTMAFFRLVATEVADDLGYTYPYELDRRVTAHVQAMRDLDRGPEA